MSDQGKQDHIAGRIPFQGIRKIIAKRMKASNLEKPQVTLFADVVMDHFLKVRQQLNERFAQQMEASLSLNPMFVKVVAQCLKIYPRMNGHVMGEEIVLYRMCNVGIAVASDQGLLVPVIKDADRKDVLQLSKEFADLTDRAKTGKLQTTEMMDATFTITNLGARGVRQFTPIVNPPELAILGLGSIRQEPVYREEAWQPASMMTLSVSFDHAAIDGAEAAEFLQIIVNKLENVSTDEMM